MRIENEIKNYWTTHWDYISLCDAIIEARQVGYTEPTIREMKAIYNQIEEYK